MNETDFTGLEKERIMWIEQRLFELNEIVCHNRAELEAASVEFEKLEREIKKLRKKIKQEEQN